MSDAMTTICMPSMPPMENSSGISTDGGIVSRPAAYENNLFFGSEDKRLHVIGARTGKVVWTYYTDGPIRSSPRIAEGHIFIGSDDHAFTRECEHGPECVAVHCG